jgi:hypothetical protein
MTSSGIEPSTYRLKSNNFFRLNLSTGAFILPRDTNVMFHSTDCMQERGLSVPEDRIIGEYLEHRGRKCLEAEECCIMSLHILYQILLE